jgi:hypothetical protein
MVSNIRPISNLVEWPEVYWLRLKRSSRFRLLNQAQDA